MDHRSFYSDMFSPIRFIYNHNAPINSQKVAEILLCSHSIPFSWTLHIVSTPDKVTKIDYWYGRLLV